MPRRQGEFTVPDADVGALRATMLAARRIAEANGTSVSYANSVIWMGGAVSGTRFANDAFEALARECGPAHGTPAATNSAYCRAPAAKRLI